MCFQPRGNEVMYLTGMWWILSNSQRNQSGNGFELATIECRKTDLFGVAKLRLPSRLQFGGPF